MLSAVAAVVCGGRGDAEGGESGVAPSGAEGEPAVEEGMGVEVIHELGAIDGVADAGCGAFGRDLDADVVPVVGAQQVGGIGVLTEDGGTAVGVGDGQRVGVVAAEACGRVVVASVAEVVALEAVALEEAAAALGDAAEWGEVSRRLRPTGLSWNAGGGEILFIG